jgi:hypothetical protein
VPVATFSSSSAATARALQRHHQLREDLHRERDGQLLLRRRLLLPLPLLLQLQQGAVLVCAGYSIALPQAELPSGYLINATAPLRHTLVRAVVNEPNALPFDPQRHWV